MDVSLFNEFMAYPIVAVTEEFGQKVVTVKPLKRFDKKELSR